jgi:hypothetical protein
MDVSEEQIKPVEEPQIATQTTIEKEQEKPIVIQFDYGTDHGKKLLIEQKNDSLSR